LHPLDRFEKRLPFRRVVQPVLPTGVELFFKILGQVPQCYSSGRIEDLLAPMRGHREYGACPSEMMRSRKAPTHRRRSKSTELPLGIPPLCEVHFAETGDDESELEQPIQVDRQCTH
jgi:hypothetical protein